MSTPRRLDLQLHLLDRQIVDREGCLVSNVDDLELELDDEGRPYVTAILVGPRALAPRLGGRLGRWISAIAHRLSDDREAPIPRIPFERVAEIGSAIKLDCTRDELDVTPLESWVVTYVIGRIPGASHESE